MRQNWSHEELVAQWEFLASEKVLLNNKHGATRLGFALFFKFFQAHGRFPYTHAEIPSLVVTFIAHQVDVLEEKWSSYPWKGATIKRHRAEIRAWCGFRTATLPDFRRAKRWLVDEIIDNEHRPEHLKIAISEHYSNLKIESPALEHTHRMIRSALQEHENRFCLKIFQGLNENNVMSLDSLLLAQRLSEIDDVDKEWTPWQKIKAEPGKAGLESVHEVASQLRQIQTLNLPQNLFQAVSPRILERYFKRAAVEEPFELRRHSAPLRAALLAIYLHKRHENLIDHLVELFTETIHKMSKRAEKRVQSELSDCLQKVPNKLKLLVSVAKASLTTPKGIIEDVIYPIVPTHTLQAILQEIETTGTVYKTTTRIVLQRAYRSHYRRMLPDLLGILEFRCTNPNHPVMQALKILKDYLDYHGTTYPEGVNVPLEGVVPELWNPLIVDKNEGKLKINRVAYEICVLRALREKLRCREIWVVGARRYRNPEEDLPQDFEEQRETYYANLGISTDAKIFTAAIRSQMKQALTQLDEETPFNQKVKILSKKGGWIKVSPFEALPEPENLSALKSEIARRWPVTSLIDILKETDLRVNFTEVFKSPTPRERMELSTLQRRLLLCLYGLGTNTGTKSVLSDEDAKDLYYVRRRFLFVEQLRQAIDKVVNATLAIRQPHIWGEATTACASDSKQFGAWDQNLITEWHLRYGGRGVMVYWHTDLKSACVYSRLKRSSSSEAAAMIHGVLRHCTSMQIDRQYVDTHGQSEVAFAFCHLLGFELMPRIKGIHRQKLYRPETGQPDAFPNLQLVLTRSINWELIEEQFDTMAKHAAALKTGTADAENLLRQFTRNNTQHPAYRAFAELGRAMKTIFLCRYLGSEELRREINEGLNIVESWNGVNDFIFYGKGGELATNCPENQELGLLSLHLLQSSLVYINTLMIQQVLSENELMERMKPRDWAALCPLLTRHINPYGKVELDMKTRLPLLANIRA